MPSIVTRLSSKTQIRRPRPRWPASDAASWLTPSMKQPSPAITYVWWSTRSAPKRSRSTRSAMAMPTASPKPWPSGPVVTSMPGGVAGLGVAGRARLVLAEGLDVVELEAVAGEVQHRVLRIEAWPLESTKRSRSGHVGVAPGRASSPGCRARGRAGRAPSPCPGARSWRAAGRPWRTHGSMAIAWASMSGGRVDGIAGDPTQRAAPVSAGDPAWRCDGSVRRWGFASSSPAGAGGSAAATAVALAGARLGRRRQLPGARRRRRRGRRGGASPPAGRRSRVAGRPGVDPDAVDALFARRRRRATDGSACSSTTPASCRRPGRSRPTRRSASTPCCASTSSAPSSPPARPCAGCRRPTAAPAA